MLKFFFNFQIVKHNSRSKQETFYLSILPNILLVLSRYYTYCRYFIYNQNSIDNVLMVSWRVKANTYFRPYILYFTPHISILLCLFPLELSKLRIHLKFVRIFYSFHCDTSTQNASNMTSLEFILLLGFVSIRIRSNPFESVRIRLNPFLSQRRRTSLTLTLAQTERAATS